MIVVAGHVCLDVIPQLDRDVNPAEGALFEVGPATCSVGGAVGNVGGALARLGVQARSVGRLGDDPFGAIATSLLGQRGGGMVRTAEAATSYSVVISPPAGDRYFLHHPGANDGFGGGELLEALDALAEDVGIVHFGYPPIMAGTFQDGGATLAAAFAEVRSRGARVTLDMSTPDPDGPAAAVDWSMWLQRVLPHVDVFMPSWPDLVGMLPGVPEKPTTEAVGEAADRALAWGAGAVLLKLGEAGAYLRTAREWPGAWGDVSIWSPNFEVEARGTTGAGDATIAGFLAALDAGDDPRTALTLAAGVGACSVEGLDACSGIPDLASVRHRIEAGWARRVPTLGSEA